MSGAMQKAKRPAPFSIRFSEAERAAVEAAAGGMPLGSYIKSVVLASEAPKYRKRPKPPVAETQLLGELLAKLGQTRHANNLNQIAKHLNQGTLVMDADLEADIKQALVEIAWMRLTLMKALGIKP